MRNILLAGALGDALGWLVEFKDFNEIQKIYGEKGVTLADLKRNAVCTDDTQMTLFLMEVVRNWTGDYDSEKFKMEAHKSFYRWFLTQEKSVKESIEDLSEDLYVLSDFERVKRKRKNKNILPITNVEDPDFSLLNYVPMWKVMAPGNTCLSALRSKKAGSITFPINDSMGCGAIMRVAPVLEFFNNGSGATVDDVLDAAYVQAAITHGNAEGILVTGLYVLVLKNLMDGQSKENALDNALKYVFDRKNDKYNLLDRVPPSLFKYFEDLKSFIADPKMFSPNEIGRQCGEGWVSTSCFGLAYYAFCKANSFEDCLVVAANHDGDSDSTASIAGQLYAAKNKVDFSNFIKTDLNDVILKFTQN